MFDFKKILSYGYNLSEDPYAYPEDGDLLYILELEDGTRIKTNDPTDDIKNGTFLNGQSCDLFLDDYKETQIGFCMLHSQAIASFVGEDYFSFKKRLRGRVDYGSFSVSSADLKNGGIAVVTTKIATTLVRLFPSRDCNEYKEYVNGLKALEKDPETGRYRNFSSNKSNESLTKIESGYEFKTALDYTIKVISVSFVKGESMEIKYSSTDKEGHLFYRTAKIKKYHGHTRFSVWYEGYGNVIVGKEYLSFNMAVKFFKTKTILKKLPSAVIDW